MKGIDALIAAVEAGGEPVALWLTLGSQWNIDRAQEAYRGSIDAALRLHEALLPGWIWNVFDSETTVSPAYPGDPKNYQSGHCEANPARAWLLAILRALKAKGEP